jgi:NADH pyrophosphatase NudC (nudix superfamily)
LIYPAAKVVLIDPSQPDKLLLIYREVNGTGGYEAAGGRVEVDFQNGTVENFETCAVREIKEEVGVDVKILSYLGSYSFFWDIQKNTCSSCVVFLGEIVGGKISNVNMDKSEYPHENRWVDIKDILNTKLQLPIRDNHIGLRGLLIKAANIIDSIVEQTYLET